jgi:hypothetical protein
MKEPVVVVCDGMERVERELRKANQEFAEQLLVFREAAKNLGLLELILKEVKRLKGLS